MKKILITISGLCFYLLTLNSWAETPRKFQKNVAKKYGCNNKNTTYLETSIDSKKYFFKLHYTAKNYDVGMNRAKLNMIELEDWNLSKNPSASWFAKFEEHNKYIVTAGTSVPIARADFAYKIKKYPKNFGVKKHSAHFALVWKTKAVILKSPSNRKNIYLTDCVFIRIIPEKGILYRVVGGGNRFWKK